tara:strand:- start:280 stop:1221 length:942 start_codon:yes stop_codon:yes gene_type:complete
MLGIGNSLMTSGPMPFSQPNDISNLIGWFDFGDVSTLFQGAGGNLNTAVSSTGDKIHTVLNKSTLPTKICEFMATSAINTYDAITGSGPEWNDDGYLVSDGGDDCVLMAQSRPSDVQFGGVSNGVLSNALIDAQGFALFMVIDPDAAIPDTDEKFFNLHGSNAESSGGTSENETIAFTHDKSGEDVDFIFLYQDESTSGDDMFGSDSNISSSKQVLSVVTGTGTNASNIYQNGTSIGSGTVDGDNVVALDLNDGSGVKDDCFSIVGGVSAAGVVTVGSAFTGNLYEVLIYNKELTSSEIETIHNHLIDKHNIT